MNPQKLVNCVAIGLFMMNVLLMYMMVDTFRTDYNAFESILADQPENFKMVLERLLALSKMSMAQLPTVENNLLTTVLEDAYFEKTFGNHNALSQSDKQRLSDHH